MKPCVKLVPTNYLIWFLLLTPIAISKTTTAHASDDSAIGTRVVIGGFEYAGAWEQRRGWFWHSPYGKPAEATEPAVHVNWFEAQAYCTSVSSRLPTIDEWQQAAYTESREQPMDGYEQGKE